MPFADCRNYICHQSFQDLNLYSNTERDHAYVGLFGPCFPDFFSFIIQAIFFLIGFKTIFVFSKLPSFKTTSRHAPVIIFLAFATLSC